MFVLSWQLVRSMGMLVCTATILGCSCDNYIANEETNDAERRPNLITVGYTEPAGNEKLQSMHVASTKSRRDSSDLKTDGSRAKLTNDFTGSYLLGDGLGVCLQLLLSESGDFELNHGGCLGAFGQASGRWRFDGTAIYLDPIRATGSSKEKPIQRLDVFVDSGKLFLVEESRKEEFRNRGPTDLNCFVRVPQLQVQQPAEVD